MRKKQEFPDIRTTAMSVANQRTWPAWDFREFLNQDQSHLQVWSAIATSARIVLTKELHFKTLDKWATDRHGSHIEAQEKNLF